MSVRSAPLGPTALEVITTPSLYRAGGGPVSLIQLDLIVLVGNLCLINAYHPLAARAITHVPLGTLERGATRARTSTIGALQLESV